MPANTTSALQPMNQGVISTSKLYYLGNIFCKVIAAMDTDSSDGSGQRKLKTHWKGFTIPDAIKNIHDSWRVSKYQHQQEFVKKLILTRMDDFQRFKSSLEEATSDALEIARI